jgi:O-antigen/teichoic acid export membrane protein
VSTPSTSLDRSLIAGIAWTAVLRWIAQGISWIATLYAARLLAPGDYGLVAMASLAIGLARMVEDFGLDALLVQDRTIVGEQLARIAGLLLALAGGLCALYALCAPLIAGFFGEPQVATIIMVLSLLFVTDALQVVPRAQLQRDLQFGRLAAATLVQTVATSAVLVLAVRAHLGHWALVVNSLAGAVAVTAVLIAWRPFRIAWPRDVMRLAHPLLQGWRVLASRVAWYGYTNADQTIIGRVLGKDALGAYSFAVTFSSLAQQEVGAIVSRVVPGIFSAVQDQRAELRRYFLLLTEFLTAVTFPLAFGLALTADLVMPLVLGPKWDAVAPPLRLLCIYAAFLASQTLVSHVMLWTGQFRANMWCAILSGVTMPVALWAAVDYGLVGIGWAWVIFLPLTSIPAFRIAFRTIDIGVVDWLRAIAPALAASLVMAAAVGAMRSVLPPALAPIATSAIVIATGAVAYLATFWFGFRGRLDVLMALVRTIRSPASA